MLLLLGAIAVIALVYLGSGMLKILFDEQHQSIIALDHIEGEIIQGQEYMKKFGVDEYSVIIPLAIEPEYFISIFNKRLCLRKEEASYLSGSSQYKSIQCNQLPDNVELSLFGYDLETIYSSKREQLYLQNPSAFAFLYELKMTNKNGVYKVKIYSVMHHGFQNSPW